MMFGIGDTHRTSREITCSRIRDLQDETGGFIAFIPWTFQRENTALGRKIKDEPTGIDYLKMLAVSRPFPRQHREFPVIVADAGIASGTGRVALWRKRHGLDHD